MRDHSLWIVDPKPAPETNEAVRREFIALENMRKAVREYLWNQDTSEIREVQHQYKLEPSKADLIETVISAASVATLRRIFEDAGLGESE